PAPAAPQRDGFHPAAPQKTTPRAAGAPATAGNEPEHEPPFEEEPPFDLEDMDPPWDDWR
ncbi:hypothetical protein ACFW7J_21920, partial [Streptomyces sp. NPDC059525]|uniref:hypothetical protein n=1 Tax=Streptomyces sp. NPDC059525 TaxID=3346857 RepID=UPI003675125E